MSTPLRPHTSSSSSFQVKRERTCGGTRSQSPRRTASTCRLLSWSSVHSTASAYTNRSSNRTSGYTPSREGDVESAIVADEADAEVEPSPAATPPPREPLWEPLWELLWELPHPPRAPSFPSLPSPSSSRVLVLVLVLVSPPHPPHPAHPRPPPSALGSTTGIVSPSLFVVDHANSVASPNEASSHVRMNFN